MEFSKDQKVTMIEDGKTINGVVIEYGISLATNELRAVIKWEDMELPTYHGEEEFSNIQSV